MKNNNLYVIENNQLTIYKLDDKLVWELGRPSKDNTPDIRLQSLTVSRKHGKFQNMDGVWFYVDHKGKNGTVYNDKHVELSRNGRVKPIMLEDGDVFVFGGAKEVVISPKTVWAMYSQNSFSEDVRVEDTKGWETLQFGEENDRTIFTAPKKGTVVEKKNGLGIYMGEYTFLVGDIVLSKG